MRTRTMLIVAALVAVPVAAFAQAAGDAGALLPQSRQAFLAHSYAQNSTRTIECDSQSGHTERCPTRGGNSARMVQQLSHSACIEGETWGFDQGDAAVWVSNGCRGQFQVYGTSPDGYQPHPSNSGSTVQCESTGQAPTQCPIPSYWQGVRIVKQLSKSPCTPAEDFGYDHRGAMWVDHGCRGIFANDSAY